MLYFVLQTDKRTRRAQEGFVLFEVGGKNLKGISESDIIWALLSHPISVLLTVSIPVIKGCIGISVSSKELYPCFHSDIPIMTLFTKQKELWEMETRWHVFIKDRCVYLH